MPLIQMRDICFFFMLTLIGLHRQTDSHMLFPDNVIFFIFFFFSSYISFLSFVRVRCVDSFHFIYYV